MNNIQTRSINANTHNYLKPFQDCKIFEVLKYALHQQLNKNLTSTNLQIKPKNEYILYLQCYLSRHCFPIRPGKDFAMTDHFVGPYFATSSTIFSSSCQPNNRRSSINRGNYQHKNNSDSSLETHEKNGGHKKPEANLPPESMVP